MRRSLRICDDHMGVHRSIVQLQMVDVRAKVLDFHGADEAHLHTALFANH